MQEKEAAKLLYENGKKKNLAAANSKSSEQPNCPADPRQAKIQS